MRGKSDPVACAAGSANLAQPWRGGDSLQPLSKSFGTQSPRNLSPSADGLRCTVPVLRELKPEEKMRGKVGSMILPRVLSRSSLELSDSHQSNDGRRDSFFGRSFEAKIEARTELLVPITRTELKKDVGQT